MADRNSIIRRGPLASRPCEFSFVINVRLGHLCSAYAREKQSEEKSTGHYSFRQSSSTGSLFVL